MKIKIRPRVVAMLLCFPGASAIHGMPAGKVIVQDDFNSGGGNWDWNGEAVGGEFVLIAPNQSLYTGAQALLRQPVQLSSAADESIHIHIKINDLSDGSSGKLASEARLFLVPAPLENPTFSDPYSSPSALALLLSASGSTNTISIHFYQKTNDSIGGYGIPLYSGKISLKNLPLTLDWWIAKTAYKLTVEPKSQAVEGSLQGAIDLGPPWEGDLRYIMRAVNIGQGGRTQLRISDFSITICPSPKLDGHRSSLPK